MTGRQAFVDAVRAAAFHPASEEHPDWGRYPGGIVHSFAGAIGADWSADSVAAAVESAADVSWEPGDPFGHELRVELHEDGRVRVLRFDVRAPAGAPVWLATSRSDGFGKTHAALADQVKARCGAPVKPPRTGALATPFRPGASRCAGCASLIARDEESTGNAGQPEFTE